MRRMDWYAKICIFCVTFLFFGCAQFLADPPTEYSIEITGGDQKVSQGSSVLLQAHVDPIDTPFVWKSSNPEVAEFHAEIPNLLMTKQEGSTTITVTVTADEEDDIDISASIEVVVIKPPQVARILIEASGTQHFTVSNLHNSLQVTTYPPDISYKLEVRPSATAQIIQSCPIHFKDCLVPLATNESAYLVATIDEPGYATSIDFIDLNIAEPSITFADMSMLSPFAGEPYKEANITTEPAGLSYEIVATPADAVSIQGNQITPLRAGKVVLEAKITQEGYDPLVASTEMTIQQPGFITKWNASDAFGKTVALPLVRENGYYGTVFNFDLVVDWGDGSPLAEITSYDDPDATHTYAEAGEYEVVLTPLGGGSTIDISGWSLASHAHPEQLLDVVQWYGGGSCTEAVFDNSHETFVNYRGTHFSAPDAPVLKNAILFMFAHTPNFNQNLNDWNFEEVDHARDVFFNAVSFNNGDSAGASDNPVEWNFSSELHCTDRMFKGATSFTQDLSSWDITGEPSGEMFKGTLMETNTVWHPVGCNCGVTH